MTEQEKQEKKEAKLKAREEKRRAREERKRLRDAELDTETTFADMNVEGFSWYDPNMSTRKKQTTQLTKKEQRALLWGAVRAMLPMIACILSGMLLIFLLAFLWLK